MKLIPNIIKITLTTVFIVFFSFLIFKTNFFYINNAANYNTVELNSWTATIGEESFLISTPYYFSNLEADTVVSLSTTVDTNVVEYIYFKSVYAPLKIWANDVLIYESGQSDSYPSIYIDTPTEVAILRLPTAEDELILQFDYSYPTQRNSLSIATVVGGSLKNLFSYLISNMGFSIIFSLFLIILAIILFIVAIFIIKFSKVAIGIIWLSTFSLTVGLWVFCDCNLTAIFIDRPSLLYSISFLAIFFVSFPLLQFALSTLNLHKASMLNVLKNLLGISLLIAVILQFFGILDFAKMLYYFHLLNLISLFAIAFSLFYDSYYYNNDLATKFKAPMIMLFFFAALELINYSVLHLNVQNSFFMQIGVILFILYSSYLCATFIHETHVIQTKNIHLEAELNILGKQLESQEQHYKIITETSQILRRQRHDLRHQLTVIRHYNDKGDSLKLNEYLDELTNNIPIETSIKFCENHAVNSVVQYYYNLAMQSGINSIDIKLNIPVNLENILDSDVNIIIGNLLDNAILAAKSSENSFIKINCREIHGLLVITMENNYSKISKSPNGTFLSTKSNGGIGLKSIISVSKKYRGNTRFDAKDGLFSSFVSIKMTKK